MTTEEEPEQLPLPLPNSPGTWWEESRDKPREVIAMKDSESGKTFLVFATTRHRLEERHRGSWLPVAKPKFPQPPSVERPPIYVFGKWADWSDDRPGAWLQLDTVREQMQHSSAVFLVKKNMWQNITTAKAWVSGQVDPYKDEQNVPY